MRFLFWSDTRVSACVRSALLLLMFTAVAPEMAGARAEGPPSADATQPPAAGAAVKRPGRSDRTPVVARRTAKPGRVDIGSPQPAPPSAVPGDSLPRRKQTITREELMKLPVEDLGSTTIAPYPIPGDRSPDAVTRPRELNTPRAGTTMVAPMPPPMPTRMGAEPGRLEFRGGRGGDVKFQFDGREQAAPDSSTGSTGRRIQDPEGGAMQLPRYLSGPAAVYPDAARRDGVQGTVMVRVEVLADGTTGRLEVESGEPRLRHAALEMIKHSKFEPGRIDGRPVIVWTLVPVKFTVH